MIRDHTSRSGDVGPAVFEHLPTWWNITSGGVSEKFLVRRPGFFNELRLFHVGLVDSKHFPRGGSRPEMAFQNGPWCAKRSEPTGPASDIKQSQK